MNINEMTTAHLTAALDAAHAQGLDNIDALEAALEARIPNSHFCSSTCHTLTDGGPCPLGHGPTEEITIAPSFGISL